MKKADVKLGGTYAAKVSGKVVPVRIDAENPRGGWDATNLATKKKVRIKSAQRLRGAVHKSKPSQAGEPATKADATGMGRKRIRIQVGHVYGVKLNGRCQPVLITEQTKDGWKGEIIGLEKPEPVTITDPKQVRTHSNTLTAKYGMPAAKAQAADAEAKAKAKKATRTPGARRGGILDAAAKVLAKAKEPMHTKAIVEAALKQGLWQTKGKTPEATLYSAIIREIAAKGKDSRFKKVGRGQFALAKKEA